MPAEPNRWEVTSSAGTMGVLMVVRPSRGTKKNPSTSAFGNKATRDSECWERKRRSDRTVSGKGWNPRPMIGKENEKGLCDQSGKAGKAGRCSAKSNRMKPEVKKWVYRSRGAGCGDEPKGDRGLLSIGSLMTADEK